MSEKVKETLEKQLELLSKRSEKTDSRLAEITHAMVAIASLLCHG